MQVSLNMVRFLTHINTCHLKLRRSRSKHLKSLSSSRRNSLHSLKLCWQMPPDSHSSCSSRNSLNSHNSLPIITRRNNNSHSKFLRKLRNNTHKLLSCKLRQLLRKLLRRHNNSNSLSNSLCLRHNSRLNKLKFNSRHRSVELSRVSKLLHNQQVFPRSKHLHLLAFLQLQQHLCLVQVRMPSAHHLSNNFQGLWISLHRRHNSSLNCNNKHRGLNTSPNISKVERVRL